MYINQRKLDPGFFAPIALLLCASITSADEPTENTIKPGKVVSLSYTVSLPDGEIVHTNVDGHPLKYKQGDGKLLPALEAALAGMAVGEEKAVTLTPEDAYGPVDDDAFKEVPVDQVPENMRKVGAAFAMQGNRGTVRVAKIDGDTAVLDFNAPLAGKTLTYAITVLAIE
jgi:FKBP-type peptidyl-prolyl cis-trans isomerase 2